MWTALWIGASCKSGTPAVAIDRGVVPAEVAWRGLPRPEETWLMCLTDADCEAAEIGCCDHCSGGRVVPVRRDHAADVVEAYGERCGRSECPEADCPRAPTVCHEGRCGLGP